MSLVSDEQAKDAVWPSEISNLEAKSKVAKVLASNLSDGDVVGVGSGSTAFVTLQELAAKKSSDGASFAVVATSVEIERASIALGLSVVGLNQSVVSWSFDGADEIDPNKRMIKGRGGAMFREKLLMAASPKCFIVVDSSKFVSKLGDNFAVPVEVLPSAVNLVRAQLEKLGAVAAPLRAAGGKDGPVVTEHGGLILDVEFADEVPPEAAIDCLPGVLVSGLFDRWPYETVSV